jgi:hypothetical protein
MQGFCQAHGEGIALAGPGAFLVEGSSGISQAHAVFVDEGSYDAGFVHGCGRVARGIGSQQEGLCLDAGGIFDDDIDVVCPVVTGGAQAFEAIDDLEVPGIRGNDADGHGRHGIPARGCLTA